MFYNYKYIIRKIYLERVIFKLLYILFNMYYYKLKGNMFSKKIKIVISYIQLTNYINIIIIIKQKNKKQIID